MANGGKRPGAGRRPGSKGKKTLEKIAVQEAFNQRVLLHADHLFTAQYKLAVGSQRVFRIDVTKDSKGNEKREHTLVTDPDEIKDLLDEHDGESGVVSDSYYYFSEVLPDNRALDSMLNRGLGKPKDSMEINTPSVSAIVDEVLNTLTEEGYPESQVRAVLAKRYATVPEVSNASN